MHVLHRIKPSEDPWHKVTLLTLQQLADDMAANEKRVAALEKSIAALEGALAGGNAKAPQDLTKVTDALREVHDEIRLWSKHSLDRAEQLAVLVRQLAAEQDSGPAIPQTGETQRLAS